MEQLVARWVHYPKVAGSSPVSATNFIDMLEYTLGKQTFTVPASLKEATVKQFKQLRQTGIKKDLCMTLAIFTGLSYDTWFKLNLKKFDIERLIESLSWIEDFQLLKKMPVPEFYHVAGKKIKVPKQLELETLGQRIAFASEIIANVDKVDLFDLCDKAVAIYMYPKITGKEYDTDKLYLIQDLIDDSPIAEVYPMAAFFLIQFVQWLIKKEKKSTARQTLMKLQQVLKGSLYSVS